MAVSMIAVRHFYGYKGENLTNETKTQITPTITIQPTPTINVNDYPIVDQLPYQGQGFVVEKYTAPKTLKVVLSKASTTSATKALNIWLESFGEAGSGHFVEFEKISSSSATTKEEN